MSDQSKAASCPPIGFVVEGSGEYVCYPSVVSRILGCSGLHIPCANAGGYGNIVRNLGESLQDLVLAYHPYHVVVTSDARDPVKDGVFSNCREARKAVWNAAEDWLASAKGSVRLHPLPRRITVVLQV